MAHSCLEFHGRWLHLQDLDILAIAHCLLIEARRSQADGIGPAVSGRMLEAWPGHLDTCGVGCIDLRLDELLATQGDVAEFLELLDRVEAQFQAFGPVVPGSFFNGILNSQVISYGDEPVENWLRVIGKIRDLLMGPREAHSA